MAWPFNDAGEPLISGEDYRREMAADIEAQEDARYDYDEREIERGEAMFERVMDAIWNEYEIEDSEMAHAVLNKMDEGYCMADAIHSAYEERPEPEPTRINGRTDEEIDRAMEDADLD